MPPTVSCSADRTRVQVGEVVNLTAQANSPDGHPLTYQWSTTGGSIVGSGATVRLDTTGARPGTVTATARVTDDRNLSASCTNTITVEAPPPPPPPPQVMLLDTCQFGLNSARVDNVCKAKLDSIALRLQSESDASLTVVGYAASNERNAQQMSQTRADNVRAYLSRDKGIAEGRLTSRTGAAGTGAAARKAEMHLVPRGATFMGYNMELDIERSRNAQAAAPRSPAVASQPQRQTPGTGSRPEQAAVAAGGRRVLASLR
jgi:outer membrane protein OmpA-like peptidoglycan-associated protein